MLPEIIDSVIVELETATFDTVLSRIEPLANTVESISEFDINASSRISSSISIFVRISPFAVPWSIVTLLKNESSIVELVNTSLLPVELFSWPLSTIVFVNTLLLPVPSEKSELTIVTLSTAVFAIVPRWISESLTSDVLIVPLLNSLSSITLLFISELNIVTLEILPPVMVILSKISYCIACTSSFLVMFLVPSSPWIRLTITKRSSVRVLAPVIGPNSEIFDIYFYPLFFLIFIKISWWSA